VIVGSRASTETALLDLKGKDRALFVSDMHLGEHDPATADFFLRALGDALAGRLGEQAFTHLFLLGDLFEIWVGDDDLSHPYSAALGDLLAKTEKAGTKVFVMLGNRDFMLGKAPIGLPTWLQGTQVQYLPDPCVITAHDRRIVLTHGDLLCTDDIDYQNYRSVVQTESWQTQCLTKPLSERQAIAQSIKDKSAADKSDKPAAWMDAKEEAVLAMFETSKASIMIHGHTHRPAQHTHRQGDMVFTRYVMPDWSAGRGDARSSRGYFLVLDAAGIRHMQATQPS
jgi:UDP-2,3-diacylglucosamine hydrolase